MIKGNTTKLSAVNPATLIVGVDIAKKLQWANFTNYRGLELGKAIKFNNSKDSFKNILASIETTCKLRSLRHVIVGMDSTGHYWKPLVHYLIEHGVTVENQSRTVISKQGCKNLRSILYQMALLMVARNNEMKELYQYLSKRPENPLKKKQAIVIISKKAVTIISNLVKKQAHYEAELVFNQFRKN